MQEIKTFDAPNLWNALIQLGTQKIFLPGEIIHYQNDPCVALCCLVEGKLKNCILFSNGSEKLLNVLCAPNLTGETAIIDGKDNLCSAVAVTTCTVVKIPLNSIYPLLSSNIDFMKFLLKIMATKMRCMESQAQDLSASISQRLARILLNYEKYALIPSRNDGCFPITHDELANILGTTRPQITERLSKFKQTKLIETNRGYIKILDYDGLTTVAEY